MAQRQHRNALHLIRDVLNDPTACAILGSLSSSDLEILTQHLDDKTALYAQLTDILEQDDPSAGAKEANNEVGNVLAKLDKDQINSAARLWKVMKRSPNC